MIEVLEVVTKKHRRAFAKFPLELYKGNPYYVPSFYSDELNILNPKKNLLLEDSEVKCFLAYKDGRVVGRIAAILQSTSNKIWDEEAVRFSRFDFIDDAEVAKALLGEVEDYGRQKGMKLCHGPWGFNDQDREGLLTFGFDTKSTYATNYNYEYYKPRVLENGYTDESEWVEYKFNIPDKTDERFARIAEHVKNKFKLKEISEQHNIKYLVKHYGKKILTLVNVCFAPLDGYVPLSERTMESVLKQFAVIINTKYLSIVVDENDNVVGFGTALADITGALQKSKGRLLPFGFIRLLKAINKPTGLELAMVAVSPEYQKKGVNAMIISKIMTNIVNNGIKKVESNPELAKNSAVLSQWDTLDKQLIKRRMTFKKEL